MKAQPFLILIVLIVAFIAGAALLNRTPDPAAMSENTRCEYEDPYGAIQLRAHGTPGYEPAIVTALPRCAGVRFARVPGAFTCYYIRESGKKRWHLYPNVRAADVASMFDDRLTDMAGDGNYTMETRLLDRFIAKKPLVDIYAFGTPHGAASCTTLAPTL